MPTADETRRRRAAALALRASGNPWPDVAAVAGYSSGRHAARAVRQELDRRITSAEQQLAHARELTAQIFGN
ncbi:MULTISPECIES: hypothetical protein [unclassified Streptomyces]|uniref:hypothetical protein n=1 Tax=unclassified Streptomyces TaxID=2593676 RepID=UPI002E27F2D8|nr:hypothetical protein [Streptomyces sp. NBC_00228]